MTSEPDDNPPPSGTDTARVPIFNVPLSVLLICAVLVISHTIQMASPDLRFVVLQGWSLTPEYIHAEPVRLVTHALVHADWAHVMMNTLFILAFGTPVARAIGGVGFMAMLLLSVLVAAVGFVWLYPNDTLGAIGASGGASGLFGAASRLMRGQGIQPLLSRPVISMLVAWLIINAVLALFGPILLGGSVAWEMHLIGYFVGLLTLPLFWRKRT